MPRILKCLILLLFCIQLTGQLNVKVGYALSAVSAGPHEDIIIRYNNYLNESLEDALEKPMGQLNLMSGINIGLAYHINPVHSFELGWENLSAQKEALGETLDNRLFSQRLFYSANQYYLAYQARISDLGIQLGVGANRFKVKDEIGTTDVRKTVVSSQQGIIRFGLAYYFESLGRVAFSVQPFYHLALKNIPLDGLEQELGIETRSASTGFSTFGIRLVFYNGPRP